MIKINLLPIRAEQKGVGLKVQGAVGATALVVVLAVCGYFWAAINGRVTETTNNIARVNAEIARLQNIIGEIDKIKERKADLEKKLAVIDDLEKGRLTTVKVMDALARAVPPDMWLLNVDFRSPGVQLSGLALDNAVIARFIQNLNATPGVTGVVLSETARQTGDKQVETVRFSLHFNIAPKG